MPTNTRPNIVLFMTDQQRGDCLGIEGHSVLQTPYLDQMASGGARFARAYTPCPVCIPARRTLMTGRKPASHGVLMNYDTSLDGPTLPGELSRSGYQTHLVGKLHLWPHRKLYGFDSADWSDGPCQGGDYKRFLDREGVRMHDAGVAHGADQNGWVARPWHLEERLHFTNWCADCALDFLERRDPTTPFFLKVSFHQPHQPCTPPEVYYRRYMDMDLPEPYVGDWARVFDGPQRGLPIASWRTALEPAVMKQYRAGYFGCINHIDDQIGRVMRHLPRNTVMVFLSDHGDMLGDHQWIRKRSAFEPSARVPLLMQFPRNSDSAGGQIRREPVELTDVMPTLLDVAGVETPSTVDGRSLLPLLRGERCDWRPYVHGECADVPSLNSGQQYLTDGRRKYIWYPGTGAEQYFDIESDPREMVDLAEKGDCESEIAEWRQRLVDELTGRPEGFTDGKSLTPVGGSSPFCLPGFERPE
jgi:arylsulfatase